MTDEHLELRKEHDKAHEETLQILKETDEALKSVQEIISISRIKLERATIKYKERLHGPANT